MKRLQRLRRTTALRDLCAETGFGSAQLIQPLFLDAQASRSQAIPGLADNHTHDATSLLRQVDEDLAAGVRHFLLFPVPATKQSANFSADFAAESVARIRNACGEHASLWVDTCLCSFSDTGHCCLFDARGRQDLETTLDEISRLALTYASAGADGVSPSDMNDGRVAHLRARLDAAGHELLPIMSYSSKFASSYYGPFRHAAQSAPVHGDRRSYQLDVRSRRDAIAASQRCADEGADLLMVKPGMSSIDLLAPIAAATHKPVGAYQVSGEYASLVLLAREGLGDFDAMLLESWQVFRRAGASYIISYGARHARRLGLG
jgi:porphobilinogen synthase